MHCVGTAHKDRNKVMNKLVVVTQLSHKMAEVCAMNRGRQSFVYTCCNGDHH